MHRVLILGCGFGGLEATKALRRAPVEILLVDRSNHHLFQPLLYQVATAGLAAPSIAAPIRHIVKRQKNVTVLMKEAVHIDVTARAVHFDDGSAEVFDDLIVATGVTHSYFGNEAWSRFAPGLKTLDDAMEIRRRVLLAYERAENAAGECPQPDHLTFVVIGAGPTGVELAGTLAEIARHTLTLEIRRISPQAARILLLEGGPRVLPTYSPDLSEKARHQLERLGVEVRTNTRVTGIDAAGVMIGDERIATKTIMWAAGVQASPLARSLGVPLDRAGRVVVAPDLSVPGHPNICVVGDLAAATSEGNPVPGVSPSAKQMGRRAALNILARICGTLPQPFRYRDYGALATIGRKSAVVDLHGFKMRGLPAWLFWLFIYIYFLIGFRNRLVVLWDWAWAYFTYRRFARIIFGTRGGDGPG